MELTNIIWVFMLGATAAILTIYYNSHFLGGLVRALIKIDATSPENAATLEELNIKMTPPLKYALRPETSYSNTVIQTDDGKFYILPEKLSMAKAKYRTKDTSLILILMSIIILCLGALALTYILPEAVESFSTQMKAIFGEGGNI